MKFQHEIKHEITLADRLELSLRLGAVMRRDEHGENGKYVIRSLYFDTLSDRALMEKAIEVNMWAVERGWDKEMGGIFYFQDVEGKPVLSLEWDMKLFWPHCEGMIALLYSYLYTGEEIYVQWFEKIADYVYKYFPDEGHPEWYGHLHRDGTPISPIKGSDWKGPFHNVRAFMLISQLLEKIAAGEKLEF